MTDVLAMLSWGDGGWGRLLFQGLLVTLGVAAMALPIGLVGGLLLALGERSARVTLRWFCRLWKTAFQAIPELLTLFVLYISIAKAISALAKLVGVAQGWTPSPMVVGALALGLVFASFAAEVWRAALDGVGRGQSDGARSIGLSKVQALRLVILPQALQLALPGLGNLWVILLKDTALVSILAVPDLMRQINLAVASTREPFLFYLVACFIYIALTTVSEQLLRRATSRRRSGWAAALTERG